MITSMKEVISRSVVAYGQAKRKDWVLQWPGQVVICGDSIFWTADVSDSIQNGTLSDYLTQSNKQIDEIVALVRGRLDPGNRTTLGALIVIAVHARDVVESLVNADVSSVQDFNWISQLRYYLESGIVRVRMITTDVRYGYEYLGNSARLVITPLTDRCYRTLMSALKLHLGGAPGLSSTLDVFFVICRVDFTQAGGFFQRALLEQERLRRAKTWLKQLRSNV